MYDNTPHDNCIYMTTYQTYNSLNAIVLTQFYPGFGINGTYVYYTPFTDLDFTAITINPSTPDIIQFFTNPISSYLGAVVFDLSSNNHPYIVYSNNLTNNYFPIG